MEQVFLSEQVFLPTTDSVLPKKESEVGGFLNFYVGNSFMAYDLLHSFVFAQQRNQLLKLVLWSA